MKRQRLEHADAETLEFVPPWLGERMQWLSDERAARIGLTGADSAVFEGVDPARMGRDLLPYVAEVPQIVNARTTNWTAGPSPNVGWARRVHPELEPEAALDKLWDEIVHVCGSTRTIRSPPGTSGWRRSSRAPTGSPSGASTRSTSRGREPT